MKNITSIVIGVVILVLAGLVGYWFWVPDVGALKNWGEFLELPTMQCSIGDSSVEGLSGTMYIGNGRLRADYVVEGQGVTSAFHTIVYEDGSAYTWADTIDFAEQSVLNFGDSSTEAGLFSISRCKRIWNLDPNMFILPIGKNFHERGTPLSTEYDENGKLLPEEVAPTE